MVYKRFHWVVPVVLVATLSTAAQRPQQNPQTEAANELWRVRAQTLTEDVLKDSSNFNSLRRALVWVKLAELWWLQDQRRARTWLTNAVEVVEQVPNRESSQERARRLSTAKLLLGTASRFDQKLTKRLLALVTDVDESTSESDRAGSANSLIAAAIPVVDRDPKRAAELGAQALRVGIPGNLEQLLFALRPRDAKLADSLFEQALNLVRQNKSPQLLDQLTYAAFPKEMKVGWPMPVPPDNLKAELLRLHADFLNAPGNEPSNANSFCWVVGSFIAPLLPEFDRLLPQQTLVVRQTVQKCSSYVPTAREELDNPAGTQSLNTIDDLLKAAADTDVIGVRTQFQYRAARLAQDRGDYERAIKILDSMSDESRALMQGSWEAYHWDWASSAALEHLRNGRVIEMNLVLNGVPEKLQPFAKMAFLDRLPAQKRSAAVPTIQFLNDAGAGLRKSSMSEMEKYVWFFGLLKLTLRYQPSEAVAVFKESIASLNRAIAADSKFLDTNEFANFLPASLLEMDEFAVKETLASVTNVEARTQLRLQLLREIQNRAQ